MNQSSQMKTIKMDCLHINSLLIAFTHKIEESKEIMVNWAIHFKMSTGIIAMH